MATQTSVLGLSKPAGNENALVSVLNSDMDLIDAEAGKVRGNIAATYSDSSSYAVGDLCIYNGILYKCNTAISGGETWNASHWTQITIDGELTALNGNISALNTGSNFIGEMICSGYNSGSGNYAELFIPINTNGKTITAVTATSNSAIFLPSELVVFSNPPTITVEGTYKNGVRIEIKYATTKTANICISALFTSVTLTCS